MAKEKCPIPKKNRKELKANELKGLRGACITASCGVKPPGHLVEPGLIPGGCLLKMR